MDTWSISLFLRSKLINTFVHSRRSHEANRGWRGPYNEQCTWDRVVRLFWRLRPLARALGAPTPLSDGGKSNLAWLAINAPESWPILWNAVWLTMCRLISLLCPCVARTTPHSVDQARSLEANMIVSGDSHQNFGFCEAPFVAVNTSQL